MGFTPPKWDVRQVPVEERDALAAKMVEWGFPRPITLDERRHGFWVTSAPQVGVLFFCEGPLEAGTWMLHAQPHPDHRGEFLRPEVYQLIRTVAGLLGARRLYAPLGGTRPGWQKFLMRYGGFEKQDGIGPYMDLGE